MTVPHPDSFDPSQMVIPVRLVDAVAGVIPAPRNDSEPQISSYGFTLSRVAGGDFTPAQLLGEDPLRIAAYVMTNVVIFLGTKSQMTAVGPNQLPTSGSNGPGMRVPAGLSSPWPIRGNSEIWVAFTGAVEVSVWVERRVQGGAR